MRTKKLACGAIVAALIGSISLMTSGANAAVEPSPGITSLATQIAQAKNATSIAISAAPNTQVGDVTLVHIGAAGMTAAGSVVTAPAGWTLEDVRQSSTMIKSWVFSHVATEAELGPFTFAASTRLTLGATLTTYRGVDRYQPVDSKSGLKSPPDGQVQGNTLTSPALRTSVGNAKAVWFGAQVWQLGDCPQLGAPDGFVALPNGSLCTTPGDALSLTVSESQLGVAASQPAWSATADKDGTNIAQAVVLRPAPAASAHRATSTASTEAAATRISVAKPKGTVPGDVLLAHVSNRNDISASLTAPGWTAVRTDSGTAMQSSYSIKSWVFYRVAGANEPAEYSFTLSQPARMTAIVSAFSGIDTLNPIDSMDGKVNSSSSELNSAKNSLTSNGSRLVWYATQTNDVAPSCQTLTPPSGFSVIGTGCMTASYEGLASVAAVSGRLPAVPFAFNGTSSVQATNIVEMVGLRSAPAVSSAKSYASRSTLVGSVSVDTKEELWEASGVASSWINPNTVYVHSEEDHATMLALDVRGVEVPGATGNNRLAAPIVGRYTLEVPTLADGRKAMYDWEDIAVGPCPTGSCIYAADTGLWRGQIALGVDAPPRRTVAITTDQGKVVKTPVSTIWRTPEPLTSPASPNGPAVERKILPTEAFHFVYPNGESFDAEAIMVHPRTGDIYVLTKAPLGGGTSEVFKFPSVPKPSANLDDVTTLVKVTTRKFPVFSTTEDPALGSFEKEPDALRTNSGLVTAASIHPDGNRFLVRTYFAVYEFTVPLGGTFDSAFDTEPMPMPNPDSLHNSEAISYASDGSGYFSIDEQYWPIDGDWANDSKPKTHYLVRVDRT